MRLYNRPIIIATGATMPGNQVSVDVESDAICSKMEFKTSTVARQWSRTGGCKVHRMVRPPKARVGHPSLVVKLKRWLHKKIRVNYRD